MANNSLSEREKRFIVIRLATWESPLRISREFEAVFGRSISRKLVWRFDVSKSANQAISKKFHDLFWETRKRFQEEVESLPLANKEARIRNKQERYEALDELRLSRGDAMEGVEGGGSTGLLVKDYKGKDADRMVVQLDGSLLAEMRALEESVAAELGQVITRKDITSNGKSLSPMFADVEDDELDKRIAAAEGREAP